jgi:hypothetical protein
MLALWRWCQVFQGSQGTPMEKFKSVGMGYSSSPRTLSTIIWLLRVECTSSRGSCLDDFRSSLLVLESWVAGCSVTGDRQPASLVGVRNLIIESNRSVLLKKRARKGSLCARLLSLKPNWVKLVGAKGALRGWRYPAVRKPREETT